MKLIIDIDEKDYNEFKRFEEDMRFYADENEIVDRMELAILNGTPIPDNATNGDVIKAMFPNSHMEYRMWTENTYFYETDWWKAPYQKGGKE
jgi:hypothetical protein